MKLDNLLSIVLLLGAVMSEQKRRGLKRKPNGELRPSRGDLLCRLQPDWWTDFQTRKGLNKLLALGDSNSKWSYELQIQTCASRGRYYLCTRCGSEGGHVMDTDVTGGLLYRCMECGGEGIATCGGVAATFDVQVGFNWAKDWNVGELVANESYGFEQHRSVEGPAQVQYCGVCEGGCASGSVEGERSERSDGSGSETDSDFVPSVDGNHDGSDLVDTETESVANESDGGRADDDESDSECSDDGNVQAEVLVKFYKDSCNNCQRTACTVRGCDGNVDSDRSVRLHVFWLTRGAFKRRGSAITFVAARNASMQLNNGVYKKDQVRMLLCKQCGNSLTLDPSKDVEDKDVWPAMVWSWLTNRRLLQRHGPDIWKVVPAEWRRWWLRAVQECIPELCNVTEQKPTSIFLDVTDRKNELEGGIAQLRAAEMRRVCNKHLLPLVRCPWGCSEYFHRCGSLSLDLIARKIFGPSVTSMFGGEKYVRDGSVKMEGLAIDYSDSEHSPYLLGNKDWKVVPSVAFINGMPQVLTCRNHLSGSRGKCFYPPRNPNGIMPSQMADQIAPAVVRPRTLKQFKAHAFSDNFQMSEMQGQFSGVDTFHLTTSRNFQSESALLRDNEDLVIAGRKDVRTLVSEWGDPKSGVLPPAVAEGMLQDAEDNIDIEDDIVEQCTRSANYVTLDDAMKLYKANKERRGRVVKIKKDGETVDVHYVPQWPSATVRVHPFDSWGSDFPLLCSMQQKDYDSHLLWSLAAMMICVPFLWEKTDAAVCNVDDWYGWMLAYLTPICFPQYKGSRSSPFKYKCDSLSKNRVEELLIKMGMKINPNEEVANTEAHGSDLSRPGVSSDEVDLEGDIAFTGEPMADDGSFLDADYDHGQWGETFSLPSAPGSWNDGSVGSDIQGEFSDDEGGDRGVFVDELPAREVMVESIGFDETFEDGGNAFDLGSVFSLSESEHGEATGTLHVDGSFHAEDIETLMASFADVRVISNADLLVADSVISDAVKIAIVYSCDGQSTFPGESVLGEDGAMMELRFVSGRSLGNKDTSEFAFMRHGGGALMNWWVQRREKNDCLQDPTLNPDLRTGERWHFAVYVRATSLSVNRCRDLMLQSMGVEPHVQCREHRLPLVTAPF